MSSRCDFYFRQKVKESELDLAFEQLEQADRDLAADIGIHGIISGATPVPHDPAPDLSIDLTAPVRAYDRKGRRIHFGAGQTVDCSVDHVGIPTDVTQAGNERWLGVFIRFARLLSDPRTDGNSQQIFFRHDEHYELVVRQAPEAPADTAPRVPLEDDELLVCDVLRLPGQTQILDDHIDVSRRQAFVFSDGGSGGGGHASDIEADQHEWIDSSTVQGQLEEIVRDLGTTSGGLHIGNSGRVGIPHTLDSGHIRSQFIQLLEFINSHITNHPGGGGGDAASVSADPHNHINSTNVQAQLEEIVEDLASFQQGAVLIGNQTYNDSSPYVLPPGTVRDHLGALLAYHNYHIQNHEDGLYSDADTLEGHPADDFAFASHDHDLPSHDHDQRYLRPDWQSSAVYESGHGRPTMSDPAEVSEFTIDFLPLAINVVYFTTQSNEFHYKGPFSDLIHVRIQKIDTGEFLIHVNNSSPETLTIHIMAFRQS